MLTSEFGAVPIKAGLTSGNAGCDGDGDGDGDGDRGPGFGVSAKAKLAVNKRATKQKIPNRMAE